MMKHVNLTYGFSTISYFVFIKLTSWPLRLSSDHIASTEEEPTSVSIKTMGLRSAIVHKASISGSGGVVVTVTFSATSSSRQKENVDWGRELRVTA